MFSEQRDRGCIRNRIHHTQAHKLLKPAAVIDLELRFLVTQVEQLLQHQHLEHDQHVNPFATRRALPLFPEGTLQQWTQLPPRYSDRQLLQGWFLPP